MTDYKRFPNPKQQLASAHTESQKDKREGAFLAAWCQLPEPMPLPAREVRFHPSRKWRWDFAWPDIKLAVEIQGGGQNGRHSSIAGMTGDCDKYNAAVSLGWRVLKFTSKHKPDEMARQTLAVMLGLDTQEK